MKIDLPILGEITLLAPQTIWILILIPMVLTLGWFVRRLLQRRTMPRSRIYRLIAGGDLSLISQLLRLLVAALLMLALAEPIRTESNTENEITVLVDGSASLSAAERESLASMLKPLGEKKDLHLSVVPFAGSTEREPARIDSIEPAAIERIVSSASQGINPGDTDIGAAIQSVLTSSSSGAVILLSDGFETEGDARAAARQAGAGGLHLFPLIPPPDAFRQSDLRISSLYAPIVANSGDPVPLRVTVQNQTGESQSGRVDLYLDDKKLFSQILTFADGMEKLIETKTPAITGGLHRVRAELVRSGAAAGSAALSEGHRWISAKERERVLLLSGTADDNRTLKRLLSQKGYTLQDIVADGSAEIPTDFKNYSTIILNNAAKRQLPEQFLPALEKFAAGGGGVVLVGGDRSFGLGEYIDTPLETISPVKFVPPQTKRKRLTNAVVLLIDKSRSMSEDDRIEAAKRAAVLTIDSLKDEDLIGVIGFDDAPFEVIRLETASEIKPIASRRIQNITASGQTNLLPSMQMARQRLASTDAGRKHVIVLSDGKVPAAGTAYLAELQNYRENGISMSAVAVGGDADIPFLKELSRQGSGAFYHTLDPSQLPQIFVHDVKVATGERTMKEQNEFPVVIGPSGVRSTSLERFPELKGFVETLPKRNAAIELVARSDDLQNPILASWKYGQGTVVAFTSDANGRWSAPWIEWEHFVRFWSELVDRAKGGNEENQHEVDFDLRYAVSGKNLILDLALFDPSLNASATPDVKVQVVAPGGAAESVPLSAAAPGRFQAVLRGARSGDYRLNFSYGAVQLPDLALTVPGDAFGEKSAKGLNIQLLSELAYLSGGRVNPTVNQIPIKGRTHEKRDRLFPPLAIAALILLMVEAFIREGMAPLLSRNRKRAAGQVPRAVGRYERKTRRAA